MHRTLLDAYRRTAFVANTPSGGLSLRIGQRSTALDDLLAEHGVTTWAYITAFNPGSIVLTPQENMARQRELERVVAPRGFATFSGEGVGDDGRWPPERSLLVLGIGRSDAVQLGRRFGQIAIVYGELGGQAELLTASPV
jgi:hypothetical protein